MTSVLINGRLLDASSVILEIDGQEVPFKEISYKDALKPGSVEGASAQRAGRTRGKYETEGSVTFYKRDFDDIVQRFGDGFFEHEFPLTVTYRNDDNAGVICDRLVSTRITEAEESVSGSDGVEVKCSLDFMYLLRNGKKPLTNMVE